MDTYRYLAVQALAGESWWFEESVKELDPCEDAAIQVVIQVILMWR